MLAAKDRWMNRSFRICLLLACAVLFAALPATAGTKRWLQSPQTRFSPGFPQALASQPGQTYGVLLAFFFNLAPSGSAPVASGQMSLYGIEKPFSTRSRHTRSNGPPGVT